MTKKKNFENKLNILGVQILNVNFNVVAGINFCHKSIAFVSGNTNYIYQPICIQVRNNEEEKFELK